MFWNRKPIEPAIQEMTPLQVQKALAENRIVLVDVRESREYAGERIEGAVLKPLSAFDPSGLPCGDKPVVLHCQAGARSAKALEVCRAAGVPVNIHMAGGILAWKGARLPTVKPRR